MALGGRYSLKSSHNGFYWRNTKILREGHYNGGGRWAGQRSSFSGLDHSYTTRTVAEIFINEVVELHGFPTSIISDRDRVFMSLFWRELFTLAGTKLKFSSAYHPLTNGQSGVTNWTLEAYLRCFANGQPKQWVKWAWTEFWFNSSYNASIVMIPCKAIYGREAPSVIKYPREGAIVEGVDQLLGGMWCCVGKLKGPVEQCT